MISLSDSQLKAVMDIAASIDPARRGVYLQRIEAMLNLRHRFNDRDVADVAKLAACGLGPSARRVVSGEATRAIVTSPSEQSESGRPCFASSLTYGIPSGRCSAI
jgi:hypothetical protein